MSGARLTHSVDFKPEKNQKLYEFFESFYAVQRILGINVKIQLTLWPFFNKTTGIYYYTPGALVRYYRIVNLGRILGMKELTTLEITYYFHYKGPFLIASGKYVIHEEVYDKLNALGEFNEKWSLKKKSEIWEGWEYKINNIKDFGELTQILMIFEPYREER